MSPRFKAIMVLRECRRRNPRLDTWTPKAVTDFFAGELKFCLSDADLETIPAALDYSPPLLCACAGLKGLTELIELSGQSSQTLRNWYRNKPALFDLALLGAVALKSLNSPDYLRVRVVDADGQPLPMQNFKLEVVK